MSKAFWVVATVCLGLACLFQQAFFWMTLDKLQGQLDAIYEAASTGNGWVKIEFGEKE